MQVICLQEEALFALIDKVVEHVDARYAGSKDKWVSSDEAMKLLGVKSATTMQKLREMIPVE